MAELLTRLEFRDGLVAGNLYLRPLGLGATGQEVGRRLFIPQNPSTCLDETCGGA